MLRERFSKVRIELLQIDTDLARVLAELEGSPPIATLASCMDRLVKILVRVIDSLP